MPIPPQIASFLKRLVWVDRIFGVLVLLYILLIFIAPASGWMALTQLLLFIFGFWIVVRLIRVWGRRAIWRLRNRLIVTYLFIAVVPVILILTLASVALYALTSQVAMYLVTSELDRRVQSLQEVSQRVLESDRAGRPDVMRRMAELFYKDKFPGIQMILRTGVGVTRYPTDGTFPLPLDGWGDTSGVVQKDGEFYTWSHAKLAEGDFTVIAPLSREYLSKMVPNLGVVQFLLVRPSTAGKSHLKIGDSYVEVQKDSTPPTEPLPPKANSLDVEISWPSPVSIEMWDSSGHQTNSLLLVRSRPSAVYAALFSRMTAGVQGLVPVVLLALAIAFLIVELVALVIGITMTRTITNTVHHLYEGTQRVMHGDFSHRIEVTGSHQLGELGNSFNQMTSRIEELLVVAKEKERLQSEIEIAREVQNQLYPKKVPEIRTLRLTAVCKPARMVSGDYFDYECVRESKVAIAVGDVAGKGISAALLMATLQSALRTELRGSMEAAAAAAGNGSHVSAISTSTLVSHLNSQLYAYTAPEKYATFYLAMYDEPTSTLMYTNAGHLPPVLIRDGVATRLNVDGTVVGAFPFAQYDESRLDLKPGDLLVCFTDGVSEPENEYGEMFGEDRLVELVMRNSHRGEEQIIQSVIEAVEQWTGSPELQDDLTLLLARRQ